MASKANRQRASVTLLVGDLYRIGGVHITSLTEAKPCRRATNVLSDYHLVFSSRIVSAHYRWFRGRIEH
jgi:hypothetical protein